MLQPEFTNPNKMSINTGHKTFDRQTNLITHGNVIANTQYSSHIHSFNTTAKPLPPWDRDDGYFQDFDCENFKDAIVTPGRIIRLAKDFANQFDGIYLYAFFHIHKKERIIHGFVFTKSSNDDFIDYQVTNHRSWERSRLILRTVVPYISNNHLLY